MGNRSILKLFFLLHLLNIVSSSDGNSPPVKINQGELKGVHLKSRGGRTYSAFMGIPYADKPEKFELAKPASSWDGVKDVTKFGSVCPQFNPLEQKFAGEEDCLFINVFTPNSKGKFPVNIFLHGGGFWFGNSNENGADYFMDEDAILVTLNYRLGALGFLSTGDEFIPGNFGLKDQLLALKWVKQNIAAFGGDISKIALFGESAGAASVIYHVISPASEGLFQRAIALSGSALNPWAFNENPKEVALTLAEKLNCPKECPVGLKKCLKSKSAAEIIKHSPTINPPANGPLFVPTAEPPSSHAFITEHPEISYKSGRFSKVPLILTICEKEGLLIHSAVIMKNEKLLNTLNENWNQFAPNYFYYDDPKADQGARDLISRRIKKFYFGDQKLSEATFANLTNLYSDSFFIHGVRNTALLHGAHAPVFPIVLAYEGYPWSQLLSMGYDKPLGMTHADDLPFIFSKDKYPKFVPNSEAEAVSKYFVKVLVTMANTGSPNLHQYYDGWLPMTEDQITSGDIKWLYVKVNPEMTHEPIAKRMKFWDTVDKKLKAQRASKASKKEEL